MCESKQFSLTQSSWTCMRFPTYKTCFYNANEAHRPHVKSLNMTALKWSNHLIATLPFPTCCRSPSITRLLILPGIPNRLLNLRRRLLTDFIRSVLVALSRISPNP